MASHVLVPFIFSRGEKERLLELQKRAAKAIEKKITLAAVIRLVIKTCPLDPTVVNATALQVLEDDMRRHKPARGGPPLDPALLETFRTSVMLRPAELEQLARVRAIISPLLQPQFSRVSLGKLCLRLATVSLVSTEQAKKIFFDDHLRISQVRSEVRRAR